MLRPGAPPPSSPTQTELQREKKGNRDKHRHLWALRQTRCVTLLEPEAHSVGQGSFPNTSSNLHQLSLGLYHYPDLYDIP